MNKTMSVTTKGNFLIVVQKKTTLCIQNEVLESVFEAGAVKRCHHVSRRELLKSIDGGSFAEFKRWIGPVNSGAQCSLSASWAITSTFPNRHHNRHIFPWSPQTWMVRT